MVSVAMACLTLERIVIVVTLKLVSSLGLHVFHLVLGSEKGFESYLQIVKFEN